MRLFMYTWFTCMRMFRIGSYLDTGTRVTMMQIQCTVSQEWSLFLHSSALHHVTGHSVNIFTFTLLCSLVSQRYAMCNELSHVHVDVNQQSSNSLTNYCSTNSCDSGTVLLNVYCKFMTKVTHSFMLILVNVHDYLLPCACIHLVTSVCVYTYVCQQNTNLFVCRSKISC